MNSMTIKTRIQSAVASMLGLTQPTQSGSVTPLGGDGGYNLGKISRKNRHNPMALSGDMAVMGSADLMHRRIRDMYNNTTPIKRVVDLYRDLIIGTGINAFCDPIDHSFGWALTRRPKSDLFAALDYSLESDEQFLEWAMDPAKCDVAGKLDWFAMQRLCVSDAAKVGGAIIKFVYTKPEPGSVPFKLQLIEREQLDSSKDRVGSDREHRIVNGIEFDQYGYEVGCWIHSGHPDDWKSLTESKFVPSTHYLHFFRKTRPTQHVGATWLHTMGEIAFQRQRLTDTELRRLVKQAQFLLVHKTKKPGRMNVSVDPDDDLRYNSQEVMMGNDPLAAEIGLEDDMKLLSSDGVAPTLKDMYSVLDHDAAAANNLSYYSLTGQFKETNYGGFKGAMNLEDAQTTPLQMEFASQIVLPVRRMFNRLAIANGVVTSITPGQFAKERQRYERYTCTPPGRQLLDGENEIATVLSKLKGGLSNLRIECARLGLFWLHVLRQIKMENVICEELGIVLDHSKGQGGQVTKNSRSRDGEKESNESKESGSGSGKSGKSSTVLG